METKSQSAAKPVKSFRLKGLSASVFRNRSAENESPYYKVSLQRSFRSGDEWKTTTSLGRDDLPIAALLLKRAWEFILTTESAASKDESVE